MSRLTGADAYGLMEAYSAVYTPQELTEEQVWEEVETWVNSLLEEGYDLSDYTWEEMYESYLEEARTDPRGRPASGPMSVYGGRGQDAGPGGSGNANVDRMDAAQRRVKATQPRGKGMAADALFTKYSARQKGMEHGGEEGPGPKAPKRSGRSGRGANTDRGSGNAAKRRMSEDFDLFDTILEHLVAEGYADTEEAALKIMANMSEEWRESIVEGLVGNIVKAVPAVVKAVKNAPKAVDNTMKYYQKNPEQALPFLAPALVASGNRARQEMNQKK